MTGMVSTICPQKQENNSMHPEADEGNSGVPPAPSGKDWESLVDRIRAGNPAGMAELYGLFTRGIRFYFYRQLGPQELDDKLHDTFLIVVQAIQKGDLRDPERLMGFVRTVVRRQVAAHIDSVVHTRREHIPLEPGTPLRDRSRTPEESIIGQEKVELMVKTLRGLSTRDREVLTRFYLQEQSQEQICRDMNLTDTQFRLLKSRAKARFGEIGRRKLEKKNFFTRTFSALSH
jgi:RNA polymerase sigma factor (sigma-70 family)